jgi:hypothetical protein
MFIYFAIIDDVSHTIGSLSKFLYKTLLWRAVVEFLDICNQAYASFAQDTDTKK